MMIIGCDYHPRYQQIAMMDTETGELVERRLEHENGEARAFYASLPKPARVGMEATGYAQWFERMLAEQGHELWIGHASEIRAGVVRKQKTDARDAAHLLRLLLEKRFPRIWIPSPAERDTRQLLRHRYKLVCFRVSVKNQLHGLAMSQGVCRKKKLFTAKGREELEKLSLGPWASRRRQELLGHARSAEPGDRGTGPSGATRSREPRGRGSFDDSSGRGSGDRTGLRVDAGAGGTFPAEQTGGELSGTESEGTLQRRQAAYLLDQQAGQSR